MLQTALINPTHYTRSHMACVGCLLISSFNWRRFWETF